VLRDLARALSLSTLCHILVWRALLDNTSNWPRRSTCWAVLVNDLLLAAIFFAGITVARRSRSALAMTMARWAFVLVLIVPLNGIVNSEYSARAMSSALAHVDARAVLLASAALVSATALVALRDRHMATRVLVAVAATAPLLLVRHSQRLLVESVFLVVGAVVFWRWNQRATRAAAAIVLLLSPFTLFTFAQTAAYLTQFEDKPPAPRLATDAATARHLVWMIFDELDYRLAFVERPASLALSELDRLRGEALETTHAYPPANYSLMSIPAMITGRLIARVRVVNPSELLITYGDSKEPVPWSQQGNVFAAARRLGVNSAVVGWFNPYCRVIGDSIADCTYEDLGGMTLWESMGKQARGAIQTIPFSRKLGLAHGGHDTRSDRGERVGHYNAMLAAARRTLQDPALGLILLHWPVPHPPGIYSRAKDAFEVKGESSYIDNLLLVDHAVADIRHTMEDAGTWDRTTVLVTSDHWWRHELWRQEGELTAEELHFASEIDHRVPFILKLAGQREAVTYDPTFNTVLVHDLILAILGGDVRSPGDVATWIDQHRSIGESPYSTGVTSGRREPIRSPAGL
jgi:hypothetical protein